MAIRDGLWDSTYLLHNNVSFEKFLSSPRILKKGIAVALVKIDKRSSFFAIMWIELDFHNIFFLKNHNIAYL